MIAIIDYGLGNLGSIRNMLKKIGATSQITNDINLIDKADKIILPGVGSFDYGMSKLNELNLVDILWKKAMVDKIPILGICLGVQLMTRGSREGILPGLGWFDAETVPFDFSNFSENLIVPHMGWNRIRPNRETPLLINMHENPKFYFVHSFHLKADRPQDVMLYSTYGYEFASALEKENILGVQFHPEKSHKYGMCLLNNFASRY
jgi:glutamine amidotransferase